MHEIIFSDRKYKKWCWKSAINKSRERYAQLLKKEKGGKLPLLCWSHSLRDSIGLFRTFFGDTTRAQWSICTVRQLHRGQLHSGQLHSKVLFIRKTTCPSIRKTPVYSRNSPNKRKAHSPISHNFVHNHPIKMILVTVDSPRRALSNELWFASSNFLPQKTAWFPLLFFDFREPILCEFSFPANNFFNNEKSCL